MPTPANKNNRKYLTRVRRAPKAGPVKFINEPSFRWDVMKTVLPYIGTVVAIVVNIFFTVQAHGQRLDGHDKIITAFQATKEQRIGEVAAITTRQEQQGEDIKEMKSDLKEMRADIKTLLSRSK